MTFAGFPATIQLDGISLVTTEPAPMITLSPIEISPMIITFAPKFTLSPMVGIKSFLPSILLPIVVKCLKTKLFPILLALIMVL